MSNKYVYGLVRKPKVASTRGSKKKKRRSKPFISPEWLEILNVFPEDKIYLISSCDILRIHTLSGAFTTCYLPEGGLISVPTNDVIWADNIFKTKKQARDWINTMVALHGGEKKLRTGPGLMEMLKDSVNHVYSPPSSKEEWKTLFKSFFDA